jgi:[protein-PII] uridylyltransferase
LYTPRTHPTFAHATAVLDELGMTIVDARIMPIGDGYSLDTFIFMELDKRIEIDDARVNKIRRSLTRVLTASEENIVKVTRAASRQVRVFKTTTNVAFSENPADGQTVMELVAADRPGLLSKVGRVLLEQEIDIAAAKIMTIGERAEDVFYICNRDGSALDADAKDRLRNGIVSILEAK